MPQVYDLDNDLLPEPFYLRVGRQDILIDPLQYTVTSEIRLNAAFNREEEMRLAVKELADAGSYDEASAVFEEARMGAVDAMLTILLPTNPSMTREGLAARFTTFDLGRIIGFLAGGTWRSPALLSQHLVPETPTTTPSPTTPMIRGGTSPRMRSKRSLAAV